MATFTVTKIKTFLGMEGEGLNATICMDGVPICFVLDDAHGGEVEYCYRNPKQNAASYNATTPEMAAQAERDLGEYCLSLLSVEARATLEAEALQMKATWAPSVDVAAKMRADAVETWVNDYVDNLRVEKQVRRTLAKKIAFTKVGKRGVWTLKAMAADVLAASLARPDLKARLKDADVVLNLLPFDQAVRVFVEQSA